MRFFQTILVAVVAVASTMVSAAPNPPQNNNDPKYFIEPGGDNELGHYDIRYFKKIVPYDEHRPALRHLIRSYLSTFRALGVETWIAHGTLLGWWWNGRIMPWDYDLDVQVSTSTLHYLAKNFNRTTHEYKYVDETTGAEVTKSYLLDINPHYGDVTRGNGMNIIDARWIDTSNGMFVDITGLMEREDRRPGVWSCKNHHRYKTTELYPMRQTEFEGVVAMIPYAFDKILVDEYGPKSLVTTDWSNHLWHPELEEWIKKPANGGPFQQNKDENAKTDGH